MGLVIMEDINGVIVEPLEQIPDERGMVKKFLTSEQLEHFGECYVTTVYDGIIKGWHGYFTKTMHYIVPLGLVKLVLWDGRNRSSTYGSIMELYVGEQKYSRITIPPGVMNSFKGIAKPMSLVVVAADEIFSEDRTIRFPIGTDAIPYDWNK